MPIELNIYDGTTTHVLNTRPSRVIEYTPAVGKKDAETVEDTIRLQFDSEPAMRAANTAIQTLLSQADERRYNDKLPFVYLQYRPKTTGESLWTSEILAGECGADAKLVLPMRLRLNVVRRNWWQANSWSSLLISNGNGTTTSGLTIRNHDDGTTGDDNWATLAAGEVTGDMPAPCRIELLNNYASATRAQTYYIGLARGSQWTSFNSLTLEGESATGISSAQSDANSSNGNYGRRTWSGTADTELMSWALSGSLLTAARGNSFRPVMRIVNASTLPANCYVKLRVRVSVSTLYETPWVPLSTSLALYALPSIALPPALSQLTSLYPLELALFARTTNAGSSTMDVDYMQLMPTEGGFRHLRSMGFQVAQNAYLYDDGDLNQSYTDYGGAVPNYAAEGAPLMLMPGVTNRLHVLCDAELGVSEIARTHALRVLYRARRSFL